MSTQIPFPNKRLSQAGLGNPLFITDIENANEDLLEALAVLYGFSSNGFAILSGFDYGAGAYTGGIVYMNGVFYRCVAGLTENQYLTPDVQDVDNKIFSDANTYPTYRIYQAVTAGAQWGGMPQFVGNMNSYRVSIKKVYDLAVQVVNSTETVRGIVELATAAEVLAGTDTERAVTPAGLEAKTATDARKGIIELATNAETQTGTDAVRAVTPAALSARTATDTRTGVIEIATNAEVQAGTDAVKAVTPANVQFMFDSWSLLENEQGWGYISDGSFSSETFEIRYQKKGKTVDIYFAVNLNTATTGTYARWNKVGSNEAEQFVSLIPKNVQRSITYISTGILGSFYIAINQGVFSFGFDTIGGNFTGNFSLITQFTYELP